MAAHSWTLKEGWPHHLASTGSIQSKHKFSLREIQHLLLVMVFHDWRCISKDRPYQALLSFIHDGTTHTYPTHPCLAVDPYNTRCVVCRAGAVLVVRESASSSGTCTRTQREHAIHPHRKNCIQNQWGGPLWILFFRLMLEVQNLIIFTGKAAMQARKHNTLSR